MPLRKNRFADEYDNEELISYLVEESAKNFDESYIQSEIANSQNREERRLFNYAMGTNSRLELLEVLYLRGDALATFKPLYNQCVEGLQQVAKVCQHFQLPSKEARMLTEESQVGCLLAMGTALGVSRAELQVHTQPIPAGYDRFIDRLLSVYDPQRPIAPEIYHNSLYKKLYEVFDAPPAKRPKQVARYLDFWEKMLLKNKVPIMTYGRHAKEKGEWTGYWCYPAAAVVAALNIDDSSFLEHEFYPTELMQACAPYRGEPVVLPPAPPPPLPAPPARKPKRKSAPRLEPFEPLFTCIASPLPVALQHLLWNDLATWVDEELEEAEVLDNAAFLYGLGNAQMEALYQRYQRCLLVQVDWKDDESALVFSQRVARTLGIETPFEPDITQLQAPERVWELLFTFYQWLAPHGWSLLAINLGDDAYHALAAPAKECAAWQQALEAAGYRLYRFEQGKVF